MVFDPTEFEKIKLNRMSEIQRVHYERIMENVEEYVNAELQPLILSSYNGSRVIVTSKENLEGMFIQ